MLVMALVDEPTSWIYEVRKNLDDIYKVIPDLQDLPSPMEALAPWISATKNDPNKIKRLLIKGASLLSNPPPAVTTVPLASDFKCDMCTLSYQTKDALMTHKYRRHGYRNPLFFKVHGSICAICNKQYFNTPRLLKHVCFGSTTCKAGYEHLMPPVNQDERDANFIPSVRKGKHLLPPPQELW